MFIMGARGGGGGGYTYICIDIYVWVLLEYLETNCKFLCRPVLACNHQKMYKIRRAYFEGRGKTLRETPYVEVYYLHWILA